MNLPKLSLSVGGVLLLPLPALAAPLTVNLTATADAFVVSAQPDSNFGAAGAVQVSASASPNGILQTLLRFDPASAKSQFDTQFGPGQWTITSATLQTGTNLGTANAQPNNPIFNVIKPGLFNINWQSDDAWNEGTGTPALPTTDGITYNTLASFESLTDELLGTFNWTANGNTNPPTIPPSTWPLSATPGFLSDLTAGNLVSFRLYAADDVVSYFFNTRTFGTAFDRPTLILTADPVPEPASLLLLAIGIGTLILRRRK